MSTEDKNKNSFPIKQGKSKQDEALISNQMARIEIDGMDTSEAKKQTESVDDKKDDALLKEEFEHDTMECENSASLLVPRESVEPYIIGQGGDPGPDKNIEGFDDDQQVELEEGLPDEYFDNDSDYDSYFEEEYLCWEEDFGEGF